MTNAVKIGTVTIGGGAPVAVQSMTKTDTHNEPATTAQIAQLAAAGCELIRIAVPDMDAAALIPHYVDRSPVPLIADIHFNHHLAIACIDAGVSKIRINPGNISDPLRIGEILAAARANGTVVRVGVNSGSLPKTVLARHGGPGVPAMVESALAQVALLEAGGFDNIVVSAKSSSVLDTVAVYRELAKRIDYPLHLGVTEAGPLLEGTVRSTIAMSLLLADGIGDTIRVSLTADPLEEVWVAWNILRELGLREPGPRLISCPMCGRCREDLLPMVTRLRHHLRGIKAPLTVAVMGCEVNGPGEARCADIGLACGRDCALLFRRGHPHVKLAWHDAMDALIEQIHLDSARWRLG